MEANAICPGDGTNMARVWMIQAQVVVSYSATKDANNKGSKDKAQSTIANNAVGVGNPSTGASSSWFGGYFSSSTNGSHSVVTKTAISSTHGNAGSGSGHLNGSDLEKLALDILSCLLQLLELKDLPVSDDLWIQSVTLCCLLYLPTRQKVRQAAHSTLPQVLSLLFKNKDATKLKVNTWDDLLSCALGMSSNAATGDAKLRSITNSQMKRISKISSFHGAFSNCRFGDWEAAQPPSQALALELMTILLPESPTIFDDVGQKTFGVLVQCFQNHSKSNSKALPMEILKALQFALVVLQTQADEWQAECRELIGKLVQLIITATEAIRKQADFEDGYIYKVPNKPLPVKKQGGNKYNIETLQGLPPTLLWKAALSIEILQLFIEDKKTCKKLWLHEDVASLLLEATSDFCTIGASCEDHMNMIIAVCRGKSEKTTLAYSAETLEKIEQWNDGKSSSDTYILGDALWTGFNTLLMMVDQLDGSILDQTFAPSLSVLQHYLKRFPASGTIVEKALEGYFSLAKVSLSEKLLRGALLSSLCKLSLPQWGIKDSSSLLKDHNVAALLCLLNIVHRYKDQIDTDWLPILQTFEELSVVGIACPDLSNSAYAGALSVSAVYARMASFSTCLSDESLAKFVSSAKEVSLSDKPASIIPSVSNGRRNFDKSNPSKSQESRGAKLINIGARAIGWNSDNNEVQEDVPVADRTKNTYYDDYQHEFDNRLSASTYPIRARRIPFSVALLADVAMANIYRHSRSGGDFFPQICSLASEVASFRPFFMDFLSMLIISHVLEDEAAVPASFLGPGKVVFAEPRQNQLLAAEKGAPDESKREPVSQIDLLGPLCEYISTAKTFVIAESGLEALYSILESTGHKLENETWVKIVKAIATVPSEEHASNDWTVACQIGFRCLKLIVDDFLEEAAKSARSALLECCSSFGSARHDLNTSLTAIGLLWTIADQDSGTKSVDRALAKLVLLSGDPRAEVRNCSVNTLFSCIVGRGQKFTGKQWESCICRTIFGVYDTATSDTGSNDASLKDESTKSRYQVSVHHSRDSADKQWVATQALVLKGMCRLLRNFFDDLLKTTDATVAEKETPWFDKAWSKILGWAFEASTQEGGRDTLDLRNSGVELMVLCNQLACTAGIHAAITPARVGTNMEVINGALRSVGSPERGRNGTIRERVYSSDVVEMWRENLFLDAFDNLEEFREHLESETEQTAILEPTQIQVLTKFANELSKLYDCCKQNEFKEDITLSNHSTFESLLAPALPSPTENDAMVVRYVRVVRTIAQITSSGKDSRFLSQAQRACMDNLKTMATDGSPEALLNLTVLSSAAFFAEREPQGKCKKGVDILSHEMSSTLLECYKSKALTDPCKVLILTRLLSLFLSDNHGLVENGTIGTSYKLLVPILQEGLKSAKAISQESAQATKNLLDNVWERMCLTLSRMLSPSIGKSSEQDSILHPADLIDIVNAATDNVPSSYSFDICTIVISGASRCLETVKKGRLSAEENEDFLNLFAACFSGMCKVRPQDAPTHGIAELVLESAFQSLESAPTEVDWNVKSAHKVCEVLESTSNVEVVIIAVFSHLSKLVGVEEKSTRRAAGAVLASANIRGVVEDAENQRMAAEERARVAESRVAELERQIAELRKQSETPAGLLLLD